MEWVAVRYYRGRGLFPVVAVMGCGPGGRFPGCCGPDGWSRWPWVELVAVPVVAVMSWGPFSGVARTRPGAPCVSRAWGV